MSNFLVSSIDDSDMNGLLLYQVLRDYSTFFFIYWFIYIVILFYAINIFTLIAFRLFSHFLSLFFSFFSGA